MAGARISSDLACATGRAAEEVALAALLGGNLFGRVAMHPALQDVSEEAERGRVLNRAWRRYGTVNSLALAALVASWLTARGRDANPRDLATAKDVAVGAVVVTGLACAAGGVAFAQQASGGAVPMESGHDAAPQTPARAARLKQAVNALGALNIVSELALAGVNAALWERSCRRRRGRKLLRR
jgi:hypothetical protein